MSAYITQFTKFLQRQLAINSAEVVFWNMLSEGLSGGQFMTEGGDEKNIDWSVRKDKIIQRMNEQLSMGRIFTCVELDHFPDILKQLQKENPSIRGIFMPKIDNGKNSSLSLMITEMLHEYNRSEERNPNLKDSELKAAWSRLVYYYRSNPDGGLKDHPTMADVGMFETEGQEQILTELLGPIEPDMPYVSSDGSAIFWSEEYYHMMLNINLGPHPCGFVGARFEKKTIYMYEELLGSRQLFDVYVAHLKSGENEAAELERVESMTKILAVLDTCALPHSVFCLDSNTGVQYEASMKKGPVSKKGKEIGYLDTFLSGLLADNGYTNWIVQDKDTACFKFRAGSDQLKKNGVLMIDTIDAILSRKALCTPFCPYKSPLTDDEYNLIMKWRNTPALRSLIKIVCDNEDWTTDITQNTFTEKFLSALSQDSHLSNEDVYNIFTKLYPNVDVASDHPMVGVSMSLL